MRSASITIVGALVLAAAGVRGDELGAQSPRYGGVELSLGLSVVGAANDYIGADRAPHLQLSTGRRLGAGLTAGVRFDAFVMESVVSQPLCAIPEQGTLLPPCEARTERAGSLLGLTLEGRWYPWQNGLGISAGVGGFYAPSVHGDVPSSGAALSAGAEYQLFSGSSGIRPVVGVRGARLLSDVGGIRWTVSPTVGLRF